MAIAKDRVPLSGSCYRKAAIPLPVNFGPKMNVRSRRDDSCKQTDRSPPDAVIHWRSDERPESTPKQP